MTAAEEQLDIDAIEAKAKTVEHRHAHQAKCSCGWDAYNLRGIMIDYADEIDRHVRQHRDKRPRGASVEETLQLVAEVRRLRADSAAGEAFRSLIGAAARVLNEGTTS